MFLHLFVCLQGGMMSFSVWSHVLSREFHFLSGPIFFMMVRLEGEWGPPPKGGLPPRWGWGVGTDFYWQPPKRAVRILLECILVVSWIWKDEMKGHPKFSTDDRVKRSDSSIPTLLSDNNIVRNHTINA